MIRKKIYIASHIILGIIVARSGKEFTQPSLPNIMWFVQEAIFSEFAEGMWIEGKILVIKHEFEQA